MSKWKDLGCHLVLVSSDLLAAFYRDELGEKLAHMQQHQGRVGQGSENDLGIVGVEGLGSGGVPARGEVGSQVLG